MINKEELEYLYIIKNMTRTEVAKFYNLSVSQIYRYFKKYNIRKSQKDVGKSIKNSFNNKYGVDNISQLDEIKQKKKDSFKEHYGKEHYFQTDEFKSRTKITKK